MVDDKDKAENLLEQFENGKSFSQLAKEASECPSSEKGGDLGWFGKGKMAKPFEREAFDMDEGDVSDPVKTQFGWHLIKKTGEK